MFPRPPELHPRGPRRSHAAGDPGAPGAGGDVVTELARPFEMSLPAVSKAPEGAGSARG